MRGIYGDLMEVYSHFKLWITYSLGSQWKMTGYVSSVMASRIVLTVTQVRGHLVQMLSRKNKSLGDIVQTLQVYHDNIDEADSLDAESGGYGVLQREILRNLTVFLKSC
jgi:hypothetical protein